MSSSNNKFRFSDRISFVTEHADNVFINDAPLITEEAKHQEIDNKAAVDAAYRKGMADCAKAKDAELNALRAQFDQLARELPESLNGYFSELENQLKHEVINIAFRIAENIIQREIDQKVNYAKIINDILAGTLRSANISIRLNPMIVNMINSGELPLNNATAVPDPGLSPGEAIVEGGNGIIDGTFAARLQSLKEAFQKNFSGNNDAGEETENGDS